MKVDRKLLVKIEAALDAADTMYNEFMEATCCVADQYHIYKAAGAKVRAARKALKAEAVDA
jgi:hypothetical protein